jgi:hypothetical protein
LSDEKRNLGQTEWLKACGIAITDAAVMVELKLGSSAELLEKLGLRKAAIAIAQRREITSSEQELREEVAAFYAERKLFDTQQIRDWHRSLRLEEAALREYLRETMLLRILRKKLVSDQAVRERFAMNPHRYARAEAEVFIFSGEGAAREFVLAVREQETGPIHGARRWMIRCETPDDAGALIFSARPGDLVGPVEIDYQSYEVYRLLRYEKPTLDGRLQAQIRDELFDELLRAELARAPLSFLL